MSARALALALAALVSGAPRFGPPAWPAPQLDSLMAAAQRAARAWQRHDFAALVGSESAILLRLPGVQPAAPLPPQQAAELLRAFAESAVELEVEVTVARDVDRTRAYVEVQRVFTVRGGLERQAQTVYLGMRRSGPGYRLAEVRVVP